MDSTSLFYIHFLDENFSNNNIVSLDYGCGNGKLVSYANINGYKFFGVDNYDYLDSSYINAFLNSPAKQYIRLLDKLGVIPFEDRTFDYVTSITVFEHVENLETVLMEIRRVLKDDGKVLCGFPLKFSYQEGHIGIPFSHWFEPSSKVRKLWMMFLYKLGFGVVGFNAGSESQTTFEDWYKRASHFMDNYCHYKTYSEFARCCHKTGFKATRRDKEAFLFRLAHKNGIFIKILRRIIYLVPNRIVSYMINFKSGTTVELTKLS